MTFWEKMAAGYKPQWCSTVYKLGGNNSTSWRTATVMSAVLPSSLWDSQHIFIFFLILSGQGCCWGERLDDLQRAWLYLAWSCDDPLSCRCSSGYSWQVSLRGDGKWGTRRRKCAGRAGPRSKQKIWMDLLVGDGWTAQGREGCCALWPFCLGCSKTLSWFFVQAFCCWPV